MTHRAHFRIVTSLEETLLCQEFHLLVPAVPFSVLSLYALFLLLLHPDYYTD